MRDFNSKEEALRCLTGDNGTYGIDIENPFYFVKTKYYLSGCYLGKEFFRFDTRPFCMPFDDFMKDLNARSETVNELEKKILEKL